MYGAATVYEDSILGDVTIELNSTIGYFDDVSAVVEFSGETDSPYSDLYITSAKITFAWIGKLRISRDDLVLAFGDDVVEEAEAGTFDEGVITASPSNNDDANDQICAAIRGVVA